MRFSIVAAVAALGSTALAQSVPGLPTCAQTCFGNNLGTCGFADIACICGNSAVINSVSCCVFATCSKADIDTTINFAVNLCKASGVNVNTSPSCPSASGSARPSGSAAASASGNSSAAVSGVTGSATPTGSASGSASAAVRSSGIAPQQTAAVGYGLGMAMAGLLAAL